MKARVAQDTSDLNSDYDRQSRKPLRFISSESESEEIIKEIPAIPKIYLRGTQSGS